MVWLVGFFFFFNIFTCSKSFIGRYLNLTCEWKWFKTFVVLSDRLTTSIKDNQEINSNSSVVYHELDGQNNYICNTPDLPSTSTAVFSEKPIAAICPVPKPSTKKNPRKGASIILTNTPNKIQILKKK